MTIPLIFLITLLAFYGGISLFLFRRQKKLRRLQPPESIVALRGPGESCRQKFEKLWERIFLVILIGACATMALAGVPSWILHLRPEANVWLLVGSTFCLFAACGVWVVGYLVTLLHRQSNERLGWIGETFVAEHLRPCQGHGFTLFHDVPISGEGWESNIDHIAVGRKGIIVIETKMRSKPSDTPSREIRVEYDGEKISWPRWKEDTRTLWQVRKNAEWMSRFVKETCGVSMPVGQVVAIPGWRVDEKVLQNPRVVSGKGVSDAVIQLAGHEDELSIDAVHQIHEALGNLCRDLSI